LKTITRVTECLSCGKQTEDTVEVSDRHVAAKEGVMISHGYCDREECRPILPGKEVIERINSLDWLD
jgi:hypothetical protein